MKRSAALAPLSRDHQHALDAALRVRAPSRSPSRRCSRISTGSCSARGNGLRDRGAAGSCPRCPPATRSGATNAWAACVTRSPRPCRIEPH